MTPTFPPPEFFGKRRRWRLSELVRYERALAGEPAPDHPVDAADERYLTSAQVRERYQVSDMWLHRRLNQRSSAAA